MFTCDCDLKQGALSKELFPSGQGSKQGGKYTNYFTSVLSPFSFCCFIPICIYYSSNSCIWLSFSSCAAVVGGFVGVFKDSSHCWPFNDAQADSSPDLVGNFPAQLKVQ